MALSIFEEAFRSERTRNDGHGYRQRATTAEQFTETAARVQGAVQMITDTLVPASRGRYTVKFGGSTAMTDFNTRQINVTAQPLYTKGMKLCDVADTLTGFVVHEIGHTEISQDTNTAVEAWLKAEPQFSAWKQTIYAIANVLDDHALEVWARGRFPGVAHTFRVTTKFVAQEQKLPDKPPRRWDPKHATYTDRFNMMVTSVRYRWFVRWSGDALTRREREWWVAWAIEYGDPTDVAKRLAGIKAGLTRIAVNPENRPPEPEPPQKPQGEGEGLSGQGESDESESEQDDDESDDESGDDEESGPGRDGDESDEDDDDWDDDEDGEPEYEDQDGDGTDPNRDPDDSYGDDDEDDVDWDQAEKDLDQAIDDYLDSREGDEPEPDDDDATTRGGNNADAPTDEGDESDEDESEEESEPGEGEGEHGLDSSDDEGDDLSESDEDEDGRPSDERPDADLPPMNEGDLGREGEGSDNAPVYDAYEPEKLDRYDKVQTLDDYVDDHEKRDSWRDNRLQEQIAVEMKTQKVTDTHGFGSMKVKINL